MKKIFSFLLMTAMLLAVGASMTSCSSGDDGEEEYVPVESPYAKILKEKPVHQLSYTHTYSMGSFGLESDPMVGNYKTDYYTISFIVYNAPADDMYDGRYQIAEVSGSV
jgi:hypothetical protein